MKISSQNMQSLAAAQTVPASQSFALPNVLLDHVFSFLLPREFIKMGRVCIDWYKASRSIYALQERLDACSAKVNRLASLETCVRFISHKVSNTNPLKLSVFFEDKTLEPLSVRLKYLLGCILLKPGLPDFAYIKKGQSFAELPSWNLMQCATYGMAVDDYLSELLEEQSSGEPLFKVIFLQKCFSYLLNEQNIWNEASRSISARGSGLLPRGPERRENEG